MTANNTAVKLKDCPFCGSKARQLRFYHGDKEKSYNCSNDKCQAHHPRFYFSEWNTRTEQGNKEITLNPDKLEELMHKTFFQTGLHKMNPYDAKRIKSYVNAIRADFKNIVEVKK